MGVDFIRKCAKTFRKSWDQHRVDLATRDLFTREPLCISRAVLAKDLGVGRLTPGMPVTIRVDDSGLVALNETVAVARLIRPAPSLIAAIQDGGGYASGVVGPKQGQSDVIEITIC